jgi:hypothetical protein
VLALQSCRIPDYCHYFCLANDCSKVVFHLESGLRDSAAGFSVEHLEFYKTTLRLATPSPTALLVRLAQHGIVPHDRSPESITHTMIPWASSPILMTSRTCMVSSKRSTDRAVAWSTGRSCDSSGRDPRVDHRDLVGQARYGWRRRYELRAAQLRNLQPHSTHPPALAQKTARRRH